jgi:hypothetical protein
MSDLWGPVDPQREAFMRTAAAPLPPTTPASAGEPVVCLKLVSVHTTITAHFRLTPFIRVALNYHKEYRGDDESEARRDSVQVSTSTEQRQQKQDICERFPHMIAHWMAREHDRDWIYDAIAADCCQTPYTSPWFDAPWSSPGVFLTECEAALAGIQCASHGGVLEVRGDGVVVATRVVVNFPESGMTESFHNDYRYSDKAEDDGRYRPDMVDFSPDYDQ